MAIAALMLTTMLAVCAGCKKDPQNGGNGSNALIAPPEGALNGLYTINANGDQAWFSKGNLQFQVYPCQFRFAENQWDFIGEANSNPDWGQWVDLMGWGTSFYNHGAVCYYPYNTSTTNSDYYPYGHCGYNLFDETGKADWGYNKIINGGDQENLWRTPTGGSTGEWAYICFHRETPSGIRFAKAQVNSINGVILVPDNWDASTYTLNNTNQTNAHFSTNIITAEDWNTTLQTAGCVFLPATGYRYGQTVKKINEFGEYWSSNYYKDDRAHCLDLSDTHFQSRKDHLSSGFAVRLIQPYVP